jgi:hypothetical protein
MRLVGIGSFAFFVILLIIGVVALEPDHFAIAFKTHDVGGYAVEKPAVMADDHGAAGKVFQSLFQGAHGVDVEIVGRFVEQQHIAALLEHPGQVHPVALAAGNLAHLVLLIRTGEIELGHIGAGIDLSGAEPDGFLAFGDDLKNGLVGIKAVPGLVDIGQLDRLADADGARIRLVLAGDHPEKSGLAGAVGSDNADNAAGRQREN